MSQTSVEDTRRPSRSALLVALAIWTLLAVVLPLGALTLNALTFAGYPLGFWITAQGTLAALAIVALAFAWRGRWAQAGAGFAPPPALAGDAIGAAAVVGVAGSVAALGYDGLALPLGLVAGLALLAILVAPRFALYPAQSIGGFFTARFGGVWPRRIAIAIAATASILLLAANLRAGALSVQVLIGADFTLSAAILTAAIGISWFAGRALGPRVSASIVFAALFAACAAVTLAFAFRHGGSMLAFVSYADAMRDLAALEQKLVVEKLSDAAALRPMSSPFLQRSMANFLGLVLAVALGVAVLPHVLGRSVSHAANDPASVGRRVALAAGWVALLLIGLVALAVFSRLGVADLVSRGIDAAAPPDPLAQSRALEWVEICGPLSVDNIANACRSASGSRGLLRMQDLVFASDAFVVAAPWLAALPAPVVVAFWAAIALAAIAACAAVLRGPLAVGAKGAAGVPPPRALDIPSIAVVAALLAAATFVAIAGRLDAAQLLADGLALIASGLFPAVVLGLYWRRFNGSGAVAAMLTGFGVALIYIVAVRAFPVAMFEWLGGLSNAAPGAVRNFETLKTAHDAATPEQQQLLAAALHCHAVTIANVGGLKPPAIVLAAAPLAVLVGVVAARLGRANSGNFAQSQS